MVTLPITVFRIFSIVCQIIHKKAITRIITAPRGMNAYRKQGSITAINAVTPPGDNPPQVNVSTI